MDEDDKAKTQEVEEELEAEDRVDEFAIDIFGVMGYTGRLPDSIVTFYTEFKRRKDRHRPGRLSPEAFATIALLADMADDKIDYPDYAALAAKQAAEKAEKAKRPKKG